MSRVVETQIEIDATAEAVWKILMDTQNYPHWNPFIPSLKGELRAGQFPTVVITPKAGGKLVFQPLVLNSEFPEIRWRGKLLIRGLFDGEHYFRVEPGSNGGTRFIHGEKFTGILVGLLGGLLDKTETGFRRMNEALKQQAETGSKI